MKGVSKEMTEHNTAEIDKAVLGRAIKLLEDKVDFRCLKCPERTECKGCPYEKDEECHEKNITWNCDGTLRMFEETLIEMQIAPFVHKYIGFSFENGGYCDCEVILNVKRQLERGREKGARKPRKVRIS